MTPVCQHCHTKLLNAPRWLTGQPRTHHQDLQAWRQSVQEGCLICILLSEHTRSPVQQAEAEHARSFDARKDGGPEEVVPYVKMKRDDDRDCTVQETTMEALLLRWIEKNVEVVLPLYEAVLQDGGANNAWYLKFQPCQAPDQATFRVKKQRFLVYEASCK